MRTRYKIFDNNQPHFFTCTIVGWLPVFTRPETVQFIFDSWTFLKEHDQFKLFAYVILENHLHLIASAPELGNVLQRFKMFTARKIIDHLESQGAETLLRQLKAHKKQHKIESEYQVWEEGSKPKEILDDAMMEQKMEYTHNNPVKRGYVDEPVHWRYSSARNHHGMPGLIEVVTDWR